MRKLVVVVAFVLLPLGSARAQFCPGAVPYVFADVLASDPFCGNITRMAVEGITTGCQTINATTRLFCPNDFVTRGTMSAFLIRLSDALFPLTCAPGQIMKWSGTDWSCADDLGAGGPTTSNTFYGLGAGNALTGVDNTGIGASALNIITTGNDNATLGTLAGADTTSGNQNTFVGSRAGLHNDTGSSNTFVGYLAGAFITTANGNTFVGHAAGGSLFATGGSNTFVGASAGGGNRSGSSNAFFGFNAGLSNASGGNNAFFGKDAGFNSNAHSNAFFGASAGFTNTAGHNNTFIGPGAGSTNTTGNFNTFVGDFAGTNNTTGTSNTYIGANAGGSPGLTNATAIGYNALVQQSNSVVLGGATDNVGIGTTSPAQKLHVVGNVTIQGNLAKSGGMFRIDHPVEPERKFLSHSFVESPDMKNLYDGIALLDDAGEAIVELPEWFGALNRDFRYQLTCIGGFANVYIAEEVANNRFKIAGGRKGLKVSWLVTGVRQDAWANANRIAVVEDKATHQRGYYLHPEAFGMPRERGLDYARKDEREPSMRVSSLERPATTE